MSHPIIRKGQVGQQGNKGQFAAKTNAAAGCAELAPTVEEIAAARVVGRVTPIRLLASEHIELMKKVAAGEMELLPGPDGEFRVIEVNPQPDDCVFGDIEGSEVWSFRAISDQPDGTWTVTDVAYGECFPDGEDTADTLGRVRDLTKDEVPTMTISKRIEKIRETDPLEADDLDRRLKPFLSRCVATINCRDPFDPGGTEINSDYEYTDTYGYEPGQAEREAREEIAAILANPHAPDSDIFG
jgi:hypothetical protein